ADRHLPQGHRPDAPGLPGGADRLHRGDPPGRARPGRRPRRAHRAGPRAGLHRQRPLRGAGGDRRGGAVSPFALAACAEMLFLDLPFTDRVRRISERGFQVEIWDWSTKDVAALARTGAVFSSMTGYLRGDLITPEGADALVASARASVAVAERLDCPRLNLHGTGLDGRGLPVRPVDEPTPPMWSAAADTLRRIAEVGEEAGRGEPD